MTADKSADAQERTYNVTLPDGSGVRVKATPPRLTEGGSLSFYLDGRLVRLFPAGSWTGLVEVVASLP